MRGDGLTRKCPVTVKVAYSKKYNAERAAQLMAPRPRPYQAYSCHWCGEWHVGRVRASAPKKRKLMSEISIQELQERCLDLESHCRRVEALAASRKAAYDSLHLDFLAARERERKLRAELDALAAQPKCSKCRDKGGWFTIHPDGHAVAHFCPCTPPDTTTSLSYSYVDFDDGDALDVSHRRPLPDPPPQAGVDPYPKVKTWVPPARRG